MNGPYTAVLLGPPGSGKSTQADFLVRNMGAIHVDVGLALRKTSEMPTPLGKKISDIMNRRMGLVPDDIIEEVLSGAFASVSPDSLVVLDGAPRRISQVPLVEAVLSTFGRKTTVALSVMLSEEESVRRISSRWMCSRCNRPFILGKDFEAGKETCPVCESALSRRLDDTEEGVRKRFRVFVADTLPVVEYYRKAGILIELDGVKDPASISDDIRRCFKELQSIA